MPFFKNKGDVKECGNCRGYKTDESYKENLGYNSGEKVEGWNGVVQKSVLEYDWP